MLRIANYCTSHHLDSPHRDMPENKFDIISSKFPHFVCNTVLSARHSRNFSYVDAVYLLLQSKRQETLHGSLDMKFTYP